MSDAVERGPGRRVGREVFGEERVNQSEAAQDELTRELPEWFASYAWGDVWTRPRALPASSAGGD